MPTITIDLPEAQYEVALALSEAERSRRAASVFAVAPNAPLLPRGVITPPVSNPESVARPSRRGVARARGGHGVVHPVGSRSRATDAGGD